MRRRILILSFFLLWLPASAQSYQDLADSLARMTGFAPVGGNRVFFTKSGEAYLEALLKDIGEARESISIEFYWFASDDAGRQVRDALIAKAREGVKVRVLFDNLVTPLVPTAFYDRMRQAGVEVLYAFDFRKKSIGASFKRVFLERDHRKLAVIDHRIGYTGGINFCHPAIYDWRDMGVRVEGPAAASMECLLVQGWVYAGGEPFQVEVPRAEGPVAVQVIPGWADEQIESIYVQVVQCAREYIYIQTPYYVPSEQLMNAIVQAARRGVDVRILMASSDHGFMDELARDYYDALLEAGVKVSVGKDVFDHSKTFVADHCIVSCGTQNLDKRSFFINLENTLFIYDREQAEVFTELFLQLEADAHHPQPGENTAKGFRKVWRGFLRWVSPLL